jgi:hypothetical protein
LVTYKTTLSPPTNDTLISIHTHRLANTEVTLSVISIVHWRWGLAMHSSRATFLSRYVAVMQKVRRTKYGVPKRRLDKDRSKVEEHASFSGIIPILTSKLIETLQHQPRHRSTNTQTSNPNRCYTMNDANNLPFVYQPLSPLSNDIRILTIHRAPYSTRGRLEYKLEHVPLSAASNYVALSYRWGAHRARIPLHIEGSVIRITSSLADALAVLWRRGCSRIWADAICINQEDQEERSLQVLRMAAVYRSANAVIAWLGEADERSLTGFQYLVEKCRALPSSSKTLKSLAEKNQSVGIPLNDTTSRHIRSKLKTSRWDALGGLLALPYWGRVWIIQELAMANTLQIIWGTSLRNFSDIVRLVYEILLMGEFIKEGIPAELRQQIKWLAKFQKFQKKLTPVPLLQALQMSAFAELSAVRDKVYGQLGLTYEGSIVFPAPSYEGSIDHISTDTTLHLARLHGSLDHIVFRATPPDRTWYINWFHHGPWAEMRLLSYLDGKSMFWDRGPVTKWKASGPRFCMPLTKGRHLDVRGYVIDTIHSCSATLEESKSTWGNPNSSVQSQENQGKRPKHLPSGNLLDKSLFWCFLRRCLLIDQQPSQGVPLRPAGLLLRLAVLS